mgnify:CR=1 FL=1
MSGNTFLGSLWTPTNSYEDSASELISEEDESETFSYIHPVAAPTSITGKYLSQRKTGTHKGTDIITPRFPYGNKGTGTPVVAPIGGTVVHVGRGSSTFGLYVEILGDDGYIHRLGHFSKHADDIEKGDVVESGQWVGAVGNTGRSTGDHLHYEVRGNSDGGTITIEQYNDLDHYGGGTASGDGSRDSRRFAHFSPYDLVLQNAQEIRMPEHDTSGNDWPEVEAGTNRTPAPEASFTAQRDTKTKEEVREALKQKNQEMSQRARSIRDSLEQTLPEGEPDAAGVTLMNHMVSDDEDERTAGEYVFNEYGISDDKKLNGMAARVAGQRYRAGGSRNGFYGDVSNGLPFQYWLSTEGEVINRNTRSAWKKEKDVQDNLVADRVTDVKMAQTHGYMMNDQGQVERAATRGLADQFIGEPIVNWLKSTGKLDWAADFPGMSFLKKGTAPYRAGATTWGVRDSETGEVVGRLRSAQRDWWDDLNVWGVGQSADDIQARKDWHQGLGQKMQRNYRVFLDQGQPEDYGFSAGEILGSAAPVDPFSRLPGQGNTTRVDPSADGIRAFLEDETAETREKADLVRRAYQDSHIPAEIWNDHTTRIGEDTEEYQSMPFKPEIIERIMKGEFLNTNADPNPVESVQEAIDFVLNESIEREILPVLPKKLIKEGGIVPLSEGGVAGHMNHLYDNPNLTFRKMKEIFQAASTGELKGTEKTDGQNLQLSYDIQTSSARAARNKGNIRDGGMDAAGLATKFGGRGALETAFTEAFAAFETAIGRMSIEEREEIFGPNTNVYYNAEVQDPRAANLINYDLPTLTIHRVGHKEYDRETGSPTERDVSRNAKKLAAALNRVQGERQEGQFHVQMNAIRQLEALSDNTALNLAIARLEKALSEAGISDTQTVGEYVISKVDAVVDSRISLPIETKTELMKRMFKEPGANIRNVLGMVPKEDAGTIAVIRELVAGAGALMTAAVAPIEEIVHDFSVEMLKGLHSAFILDNEAEVVRLRQETSRAITAIEGSNSEEAMEILAKQMGKLKDVEGVSTAAEGFVFDYDDVTYKFTGNFAPMNQLLGLFKYGRGDVPPMQKLDEEEEAQINRTVAIIPGGFKPPHKGHLAMVEHYSKLADIVFIFISPLSRGSSPSEAEVGFRQSKDIWDLYTQASGLNNVKIIDRPSSFNSPVQMAYEFSENKKDEPYLAQAGDRILFGASEKSDKKGNPDWMRFQNAQNYVRDGAIAGDAAEFASPVFFEGLSATDFRRALHNADIEAINQFIPEYVDSTEILSILGIDAGPEYPIEEMSSMGGGAVEGGGSGQERRDSLIQEEDGIIKEVLNYLLQKRNSND